jgi:hypothetical protein
MRRFWIMTLALLQTQCLRSAEPVPDAKLEHVGLWEGKGMRLLITRDGAVQYERHDQGGGKDLSASIQSWQADGFTVGMLLFRTFFKINDAPHKVARQWRMTVDGVALHRVESTGFAADLPSAELAERESPPEGPPSPLLDGKLEFVGVWEAQNMRLVIRRDGHLSFQRLQAGGSPSLAAPLVSLSSNAIVAGGGGGLDASFRIDSPPKRSGADWKMTVDGVELQRVVNIQTAAPYGTPLDPAQLGGLCSANEFTSCNNLAAAYEDGLGVQKDAPKAAELYQRACDGGFLLGCANLGMLYFSGTGVAQDRTRAMQLFERACDGGAGEGCSELGFLYDEGIGVEEDNAAAARLLAKGCEGNVASSCARLGVFYTAAEEVPLDYRQAFRLFAKACAAGDAFGCFNLGALFADGLGVQRDLKQAAALFSEACNRGDAESCGAASRLGTP